MASDADELALGGRARGPVAAPPDCSDDLGPARRGGRPGFRRSFRRCLLGRDGGEEEEVKRPYTQPGIGWLLAVLVLILAVLSALGVFAVPVIWLVVGLALAILL